MREHQREKINLRLLQMVQLLLEEEEDKASITPTLIEEKIEDALSLKPSWQFEVDCDWVISELIRRYSVWMGQSGILVNNEDHETWLTTERKRDWRYWQRYREWQEEKLPWIAVQGLDDTTDEILGLLEDPVRSGGWDRRGLVVGHVQSGKTGNYTGLICKAADAGYKIIIVLSGLHNNLRAQTQIRLDEGFLGFETSADQEYLKVIGVGEKNSDISIKPNFGTYRAEDGDFSARNARNLGITPEQKPWLFVVKKNKSVLQRLLRWIQNHVANITDPETGKRLVTNLPLLIIDDEADNASVDTGETVVDENNQADPEHQPTAINSLIRRILNSFSKKAYVGYTATPFANIFIHEKGSTNEEGPDLFPSSFILNLSAPSNYVGPARVFGLSSIDGRTEALDLTRTIADHCSEDGQSGWMPVKHKNNHSVPHINQSGLPKSLEDAISSFFIACAVRKLRGQGSHHSSMLVHVTRFNAVQKTVHQTITNHLLDMKQKLARRIGHQLIHDDLKTIWQSDFVPSTVAIHEKNLIDGQVIDFSWDEVWSAINGVIDEVQVRMINGFAKDALDYAESVVPLKIIAVGGDKLARGLTLEGLCTSYFLRASRMYDTLMQMGRWFGYRLGYLDLCRLYTTGELIEWFEHITDASEELREEFDAMVARKGTPLDYGLKVKSHPVLMVTSRLKMRSSKPLYLSFSGEVLETISFFRDSTKLKKNLEALSVMITSLGQPTAIPSKKRGTSQEKWNGVIWENISHLVVEDFLNTYETHPDVMKVNSKLLAEFISKMAAVGELTNWTIAVIGGSGDEDVAFPIHQFSIPLTKRKSKGSTNCKYSIGRLLSPKDEGIDIDEAGWLAALDFTKEAWHRDPGRLKNRTEPELPSGPSLRYIRGYGAQRYGIQGHADRGLLMIYLLDAKRTGLNFPPDSVNIVAFGISFPGSKAGVKVKYEVNNVLWESQYGSAE
ncbi:MAG: Z1 domain-containing protein [Nitrosomonas sp.]|uniref:Z1 domain-containing protein n=1 Tax=Nitrosomonas sp. TaxID=42353 RepID=UPI0025CFA937|nr:Z1 domain-containing protein [Nitrosomonas sp.]MBY0473681.1 Z1 domain-containing protein [Nitrosomonas sp.]